MVNIDLSRSGFEGRLDELRPFLLEIVRLMGIKGVTEFIDKEFTGADDERDAG